jgi:hypothetical protein
VRRFSSYKELNSLSQKHKLEKEQRRMAKIDSLKGELSG